MANQEHLDILRQGVSVWNAWREQHQSTEINFSGINFRGAELSEANLKGVDLSGTDLSEADLRGTDLDDADLRSANLFKADLMGAFLQDTNLSGSNLINVNLNGADFNGATLKDANLVGATLVGTSLIQTIVTRANFSSASMGFTILGNLNLSTIKGLETVIHLYPSTIGIDTIYKSQGTIPDVFLRGTGVQEFFLENMVALTNQPIQYYTCFISYSSKDQSFAERIYADLQTKDVRCWFAPHHMKTGDPIRERIDESIRFHDKLLLILSQYSVRSSWVETEVEKALDKERRQKKSVLFPIRLDDSVTKSRKAWAAEIQRTRHITDFTNWKQHDDYQKALKKLLDDLKAGE